jgi:S-adenosylmethionine hydrolase
MGSDRSFASARVNRKPIDLFGIIGFESRWPPLFSQNRLKRARRRSRIAALPAGVRCGKAKSASLWLSCIHGRGGEANGANVGVIRAEAGRPPRGRVGNLIVLFTDFGLHGPYVGQMRAVLHQAAPDTSVIDLFADAPIGDPKASAYLLAAYAAWFPAGTVFLCVVDPGVGSGRPPIVVEADGRWFVGPGNGLFELVQRRARQARDWRIEWKPERLSASFHGRDLFAPVAAMLARGEPPPGRPCRDDAHRRPDWPDDLGEVVYADHFGNAMTGLRAAVLPANAKLAAAGRVLERGRTFSDLPPGAAFWYENSNGLAEIAVNLGRADRDLGLAIGMAVEIIC